VIPNVGSQYNSVACPRSSEEFPGGLCAFNLDGVIPGSIEGNRRRNGALRLLGGAAIPQESGDQNFNETALSFTTEDGVDRVLRVQLQGTKGRVVFQ